jgi:exodeoxyribonuclease V gamma subunit
VRTVTYSRLAPKHRLTAWVRLLALTAAHPERAFAAATVGRGPGRAPVAVARIAPLAADAAGRRAAALAELAVLVDLYDRGMREPLPLYCNTSAAWVEALVERGSPEAAAAKAWESDWDFDREDKELEHQLVLGGRRPFADVVTVPPRPDEIGDTSDGAETTRFGRYARRLWDGLLSCEELVDQ